MNNTKLNPLSYYQARIYNYIKDYHPYLLDNRKEAEEIIITRARDASEAFQKAVMEGKNGSEAAEIANEVLHADLEFSPISYLQELYEEKIGQPLDDRKACEIYRETKEIFDRYGRDIEGSDEENDMISELVPFLT
jgi:hypothetical protein